jgi:hypothetical protein
MRVAEAPSNLVSDAAEHVHGHMLVIDGGTSTWQQPAFPEDVGMS